MPVENEYKRRRLESDGANTEYDFYFKITDESEVKVSSVVRATGVVDEVLVLNTDYTVEISTTTEGGTVTLTTPLANTYDVLLESNMANTQTLRAGGLGVFNPAQIVAALDRTVRLIQQVVEKTARTLSIPETAEGGDFSLEIPVPEANKILGWDSDGTGLENKVAIDEDAVSACAASKAAAEVAQGLAEDARDVAIIAQGLAEDAAAAAEAVAEVEIASQAEAEAGSDNSKLMTPLRTKQAIDEFSLPLSYLDTDDELTADSDVKVPSQQAVKAYIDNMVGEVVSNAAWSLVQSGTISAQNFTITQDMAQGDVYRVFLDLSNFNPSQYSYMRVNGSSSTYRCRVSASYSAGDSSSISSSPVSPNAFQRTSVPFNMNALGPSPGMIQMVFTSYASSVMIRYDGSAYYALNDWLGEISGIVYFGALVASLNFYSQSGATYTGRFYVYKLNKA